MRSVGSTGEIYICRNDKALFVYDRNTVEVASKALGHNRISVIAAHYIQKN